jgi:hypothetical protein
VKQALALAVGGDLPGGEDLETRLHLQQCPDCREWGERLLHNQSLLRSLRQDTIPPAVLSRMREGLRARLEGGEARLGWWLRFERFLVLQWRRPRYAVVGAALAIVITASLFAQLRQVSAKPDATASMIDTRTAALDLPKGYRDWALVGVSTTYRHAGGAQQNVYMSPSAYREYRNSGKFPEGAVMVLESRDASGRVEALSASVKDRNVNGGWGYFRFEADQGRLAEKASILPVGAGCVACHSERGATDHVFTQFYPVLRDASGVL